MTRHLIVNADDFGQTSGISRGIVECHQNGVVTSTSLMVTGRAVDEAVRLSQANPRLAVGLHFDVWGEDEREFDTHDISATHDEFQRQLEAFEKAMRRLPTHLDSHRHAHREEHLFDHFQKWCEPLGIPVRGDGKVNFVGGFYGQWEWGVTELKYVSVDFLRQMLKAEVPAGITEFSCHPGYITLDYRGIYAHEREAEIATLVHPAIRRTIEELEIRLVSYADYARIVSAG